jgi:hypothetical protein
MGEQCGDLRIAIKAVNDGTAFGHAPTQALYMGAAMNRRDQNARTEDDRVVEGATGGVEQTTAAAKDLGDKVADMVLGAQEGK